MSLLLSVAAILVSIATAIAAYRQGSHQGKIQGRLLALEQGRERDRRLEASSARIQAAVHHSGSNYRLHLVNTGSSEARMISTRVDGTPILNHDLVPQGMKEIRRLGSGASADYPLAVHMAVEPRIEVSIEWEDSSGNPGSWSSELSLF